MQHEYDILLSLTTPLGLVSDLGYDVRISSRGHHTVVVPEAGELWVTDHGFLALDGNSLFACGGCADFLAMTESTRLGVRRLDTYRAAITVLDNMYGNKLPTRKDDASFVERIAVEAFNRRAIFNSVIFPLRTGLSSSASKLCLDSKLMNLGIDLNLTPKLVSILEPEDWVRFKDRCAAAGVDVEVPTDTRIVYPYFKDFSSLAMLAIPQPHGDKHIQISPSRLSYSGILNLKPEDAIFMAISSELACITTNAFRHSGKTASCLGVNVNNTCSQLSWKPERVKFIVTPDISDFRKPAALSREGVVVDMLPARTSGEIFAERTVPWNEFIVDSVIEELLEHRHMSSKAKLLLESCHLTPESRFMVSMRLREAGLCSLSDSINQMFHDGILLENNSYRIFSSPTGYRYQRQHALDTPPEELSNFTVKLLTNATFPDDSNVYHKALITLKGQQFETVIRHDDLETAKKLDKAIKVAEMQFNAGKQDGRVTPVITELTVARFLIPHLRETTARLPSEEGVSFIGWNGIRSMFHAPGFHVYKKDGMPTIEHSTRTKHPGILALNNYDFGTSDISVITPNIPYGISDVISQICAMIGRYYHGYTVKPVAIRNTPSATKVLKRLFRCIGQLAPMELNSNQRLAQDIPGIKGYPVLATGYNRQQIRSSRLPLFMLTDYGYTIPDDYTEAQLVAAEGSLKALIQKVSFHIISTEGSLFKRVHSLSYENELVREGAELICRAASIKAWPISVTPYEAVEKVLRSIPVGDIRKYFSHDLGKQLVYFYYTRTPEKANKQDLILELSPLVSSIKDGVDHLAIDAVSALDMLQNFYHEPVQLEPVNLPGLAVAVSQ